MNSLCSKNSETIYCTTESAERFENLASFLLNESISAKKISVMKLYKYLYENIDGLTLKNKTEEKGLW